MFRSLSLSATICLMAGAAAAEVTYANAFAKYHNFDVDGAGDADAFSLGGAIEYRMMDWTFNAELGRIDIEDVDFDFGTIGAGYQMRNGVTLGLDYTRFEIDSFDSDVVSGYAMLDAGSYALGASIGDGSDLDDTVYSIFGAMDVTANGRVGLDIVRIEDETLYAGYADYDMQGYELKADVISMDGFDLVAVAGAYEFGNGFSAIASLSHLDLLGLDGNAFTIGGRYEFAPGVNAELALGQIDFDGAQDIDQITFGVQYELGDKTSKRRSLGNIFSSATSSLSGLTSF
ncbi:2-isopropylmalate synthase [Sulfitobacter aestuarii]|uniref:2-isopropylmalate synthase n=1 Tax=Sulfitobacter aestuarii TaxID=2161676 RepID=A0ABW5U4G9_9RHOB